MFRLARRFLIIALMAALLVPAAPRQAEAWAWEAAVLAAMALIGKGLVLVQMQAAQLAAVATALIDGPNALYETTSLNVDIRLADAKQRAKHKLETSKLIAEATRDHIIPRERMACVMTGNNRRAQVSDMLAARQGADVGQLQLADALGRSESVENPNNQVVAAATEVAGACLYDDDEQTQARCREMGLVGGPEEGVGDGDDEHHAAMPNADINPTTVLNTDAFDNEEHAAAGMAFCRNLISNSRPDMIRGSNIYQGPESLKRYLRTLTEQAATQFARMVCNTPWQDRVPMDGVYNAMLSAAMPEENLNPTYRRLQREGLYFDQGSIGDAFVQGVRLAFSPILGPLSLFGLFNPANQPSNYQRKLAILAQLASKDMIAASASQMSNSLANLVFAKTVALQLRFQEYKSAERDMLLEAIALGRAVRQSRGQL